MKTYDERRSQPKLLNSVNFYFRTQNLYASGLSCTFFIINSKTVPHPPMRWRLKFAFHGILNILCLDIYRFWKAVVMSKTHESDEAYCRRHYHNFINRKMTQIIEHFGRNCNKLFLKILLVFGSRPFVTGTDQNCQNLQINQKYAR